ncbi:unnamed protein product [Closterium sp. Yama58-4]|nr:unnamed protein product [Closterium sp. Yama58-4]
MDEYQDDGPQSSQTYSRDAGSIREGNYIVISGRPCKVVDVSTKTTSSGHKKLTFVATDLFTNDRRDEMAPYSHSVEMMGFNDYTLLDITEEGFVSVMNEKGDTRDDLPLPPDEALRSQIKAWHGEDKELSLSVISAMGQEQIFAVKEINAPQSKSSLSTL